MLTTLSSLVDWLIANAVAILFLSITATVLLDLTTKLLRRAKLDRQSIVTSVSAGVAYISAKGVVAKGVMLAASMWIYANYRIFDLDSSSPVIWVTMFFCRDFIYYWIHRCEHSLNLLWASHMVHHSSEQFSFTTAVRMPWMEALYRPALALWAPLLGFHPVAFAAMGALVLVVGQFQHTELMQRRTILDKVLVTPSAHRVHHGSNPEYIDKNFGSMLIIWDRMFRTYEPEHAKAVYGLVGEQHLWNARRALLGGYSKLAADVKQLSARDKVRHLFSGPT